MNATPQADQLAAAVAHVQRKQDDALRDGRTKPGNPALKPWLTSLVAEAFGAYGGTASTCAHVAAMAGPAPVYLDPRAGMLSCWDCYCATVTARDTFGEVPACDYCRVVPPGGGLCFNIATMAPVVIPLALCPQCARPGGQGQR